MLSNGYPVKAYPALEKAFFMNLISGKCDLKIMVWKQLQQQG